MRLVCLVLLASSTAAAQPAPGVLARDIFTGTITAEIEASKDRAGDPTSIAPDFAYGISDQLTLSALTSTFGRTGFRGGAGLGICVTDACAHTFDNAGVEAAYGIVDGTFAIAANGGVHALSFDGGVYAAKAGARMRVRAGPLAIASLPSVLIVMTERDAVPDRLFIPLTVSTTIANLTLGVASGFKSTLDDAGDTYEIAIGGFVQYVATPSLAFSASYIHGDASDADTRVVQVWVTITRSAYPRYK
jgi:hypothetical protein